MASLAELNQRIAAADIADDGRVITGRPVTVAAAFAAEQPAMLPLPAEVFDPARLLQARVDNRARVCVRQNYYSVPARYAGRRLARAAVGADRARSSTGRGSWPPTSGRPADTPRCSPSTTTSRCSSTSPARLPGATALAQARAAGAFTASHQRYWDAARRARGDAAAPGR